MSRFRRDLVALERARARVPRPPDESAEVREILRRVPLEGNPTGAPSNRALSRWYDAQPDGDYTCTSCGRVGPKHYVQPQHPYYVEGRTGVASCTDCTNRQNEETRARGRAAKSAERASAADKQRAAHAPGLYPDGRTIPREGDEVYTYIPGFGGMPSALRGVVKRQRGVLVVSAGEASSLLGGRERLARARTLDLTPAWTVKEEQHPHDRAQERSLASDRERKDAHQRSDAELQDRLAASKAAGARHLDEVGAEVVGRRAKSLRTGEVVRIVAWDDKCGPLYENEHGTPVTMGKLAQWAVVE